MSLPSLSWISAVFHQWFLVILFFSEMTVKIAVNKNHQLGVVEDHTLYDEISNDQRGTSLAVASLVFAGLAIIFSNNPGQHVKQIEVLSVAFGFLLIAAFAHELTLTYRMVLTIQEMSLEYGLLLMVYALYLLIVDFVPDASGVMFVVFTGVIFFRFLSVKGEIEAHYNE